MADGDIFGVPSANNLAMLQAYYGMGGGGGMGFDPSLLMDPRKRLQMVLAQNMMQQGMSTEPTLSPWAGLARVAGAVIGGNKMNEMFAPQGTANTQAQSTRAAEDAAISAGLPADQRPYWEAAKNDPLARQQFIQTVWQPYVAKTTEAYTPQPSVVVARQFNDIMGNPKSTQQEKDAITQTYYAQLVHDGFFTTKDANGNLIMLGVTGGPKDLSRIQAEAWAREHGGAAGAAPFQTVEPGATPMVPKTTITGSEGPPSVPTTGGGQAAGGGATSTPSSPPGSAPITTQPLAPPSGSSATAPAPTSTASATAPGSSATTPAASAPAASAAAPAAPLATGITQNALMAGIQAGERTRPGQVGAAGETTSYQITKAGAASVGAAQPQTEEQGRAVAQAIMAKNMATFKDPRLAFAAYNWGPNAVANWVNQGADPAKMPASVRAYVQRAMDGMNAAAGGGTPAAATTSSPPPPTQSAVPSSTDKNNALALTPPAPVLPGMSAADQAEVAAEAQQIAARKKAAAPAAQTAPATQTVAPPPPTQQQQQPTVTQQQPSTDTARFNAKDPLKNNPDIRPAPGTAPNELHVTPLPGGGNSVSVGPNPQTAQQIADQDTIYKADVAKAAAVPDIKSQLLSIRHAADMLDGSYFNIGPGHTISRTGLDIWNGVMRGLGLEQSDASLNVQQAYDILDKATVRLQLALGGQVGGGAESTIQTAGHGVPSAANTPAGLRSIVSSLWMQAERQQDIVTFKDAYRAKAGNLIGAQDTFDRTYTPQSYQKAAQFDLINPNSTRWQSLKAEYASGNGLSAKTKAEMNSRLGAGMGNYIEQMIRDGIEPQQY